MNYLLDTNTCIALMRRNARVRERMEQLVPGDCAVSAITAMEVGVYYLSALRGVLPPLLIAMSAVKFSLVVMYYMHLKFDNPLFTTMFLFGLMTAIFTIIAFLAFFGFVNL